MTASTPQQRADSLYAWLTARSKPAPAEAGGELPGLAAIAKALPFMGTDKCVFEAFRLLASQGRIEQRHGTRDAAKGHRIVRIVATGMVLKTAGCALTLDGPPNRRAHQVADDTLRRVMAVVEDCAARGQHLPRTERLGQQIGRSGDIARRVLCELHDAGLLTLIQRGMRRAAELPDGRTTR